MKTTNISGKAISREWFIADAADAVVGRLATRIATILKGKHKATYTPHLDIGDFVVVVNAEKARFTGKKEQDKRYWSYTGFIGGIRSKSPAVQRDRHPERVMMAAVKGMLPKGPLGRQMLAKLKVYAGSEHPHAAQQPKTIEFQKGAK
ncbi:MAG: 50S ribosomal protein L13 [Deltaproteobacteria bacterium]|nr:50S ribosomal protein L13 [Deltaproteobacteria bacterium]